MLNDSSCIIDVACGTRVADRTCEIRFHGSVSLRLKEISVTWLRCNCIASGDYLFVSYCRGPWRGVVVLNFLPHVVGRGCWRCVEIAPCIVLRALSAIVEQIVGGDNDLVVYPSRLVHFL